MSEKLSASNLSSTIKALEVLMKSHIQTMGGGAGAKKTAAILPLSPAPKTDSKFDAVFENLKNLAARKDKVTVYVRVIFLKIGVIDTIHDRYSAEVMVQTKWREPFLDRKKLTNEQINFTNLWNPKISISNGIGELKYTTSIGVQYDAAGNAWLVEKRKTSGNFFEFMELNKFPFDGQDLTVTVSTERVDSELEFKEDEQEESGVNTDAFSAAQEWLLHEKINIWTKFNIKKVNKKKVKYPCLSVAAKVSRRPQFFIYNIIVIMFSICSLAFSTFTVKMEAPESRLPLTFILVLTTVTFKFVVNKSLPKISYLTYLDKYILGSMFILVTVCIWHSLCGSLIHRYTLDTVATTTNVTTSMPPTTTAASLMVTVTTTVAPLVPCTQPTKPAAGKIGKMIDLIALGLLASIYVGFHITFLFLIICNKGDDDVNEELNMSEDDDDEEDAQAIEKRSNMAMVALGLLNKGEKDQKPNDSNNNKEGGVDKDKTPSARLRTPNNSLPTVQE